MLVAEVMSMDGSWEETKYSVEKVGLSQPARRERGSKTVKIKRGMGGSVEVMVEVLIYRWKELPR